MKQFNETFYAIDYKIPKSTLLSLSQSRQYFQLDCVPNFDRPSALQTYILMNQTFQMSANSQQVYLNDMQLFEGDQRRIEFTTFLKNLFTSSDKSAFFSLQCVTYIEGSNLFAQSKIFYLIRDESRINEPELMTISNHTVQSKFSNLEIILISLTSVVSFLILLIFIILLLYYCYFRTKKVFI